MEYERVPPSIATQERFTKYTPMYMVLHSDHNHVYPTGSLASAAVYNVWS